MDTPLHSRKEDSTRLADVRTAIDLGRRWGKDAEKMAESNIQKLDDALGLSAKESYALREMVPFSATPVLLIVDDDAQERSFIQLVCSEGFATYAAASANEAAKIIESKPIDVAIIDIYLEGIPDGLSVLNKLKKVQPYAEAILVTCHSSTESMREALHLAAFDYLEKPFRQQELLTAISGALARRAATTAEHEHIPGNHWIKNWLRYRRRFVENANERFRKLKSNVA